MHSISDLIVRSHTVYANLQQTKNSINKSELYEELDPTEKSAISYFLGMIASKIICSRLLNTPFVFHLSMLKKLGGKMILRSKSQPDLIGLDKTGKWIVAEAKGRTNNYDSTAMAKAKLQTRQLRMINGTYPSLRVGIQAYFSPDLEFAVSDPDEYASDAEDINLDLNAAIRDYYSYFLDKQKPTNTAIKIQERDYLFNEIDDVGVSFGIETSVLKNLEKMKV